MNGDYVKSRIKLTIGILVSNRIEYIEKVMLGIKPLLDKVPSELIAIDTVGPENSDGSIDVVRKYTDKIFRFEWCNDFSKARNVCLEHAKGEWFMFLDDDEVFEDVSEIVDFFVSGECEHYLSGIYHLKNHLNDGIERMSAVLRLIRRKEDTCFVGRIHESFNEVSEPCKLFGAYVNHYGYRFVDEEAVKRHQERNLSILREEIRDRGLTTDRAAQLVQEMLFTKGTEDEGYRELIECREKFTEKELSEASGQWLLTAGVSYYYNLGKHEEALEEDRRIRERYTLSETSRLVLSGTCIFSAAKLDMSDACVDYAKEYISLYEWLSDGKRETVLQMGLGTEDFRQPGYARGVLTIGILAAHKAGRYDEGLMFLAKMAEQGIDPDETVSMLVGEFLEKAQDAENKKAYLSHFLTEEGKAVYGYK